MGFTSGGYIMQRGLGRAQFGKLETVASRFESLRSLLRKPLFPAKWIISELSVVLAIGGVFIPVLAKHTRHLCPLTFSRLAWTAGGGTSNRRGSKSRLERRLVFRTKPLT